MAMSLFTPSLTISDQTCELMALQKGPLRNIQTAAGSITPRLSQRHPQVAQQTASSNVSRLRRHHDDPDSSPQQAGCVAAVFNCLLIVKQTHSVHTRILHLIVGLSDHAQVDTVSIITPRPPKPMDHAANVLM
jgi:hypothetical protein